MRKKTILSLCMAAAACHGSIDATTAERGCVKNAFLGTSSCYIFIGYTVHTALPLAVFPHPYSQNRFL